MQITKFSDISLRVMQGVAADPERIFGISELSQRFNTSNNHMVKVAHTLTKAGYLKSIRGRNGGVMIGKDPSKVTVGELIRTTETSISIIDCGAAKCPLTDNCKLKKALNEATNAFFKVLDDCTLLSLTKRNRLLNHIITSELP